MRSFYFAIGGHINQMIVQFPASKRMQLQRFLHLDWGLIFRDVVIPAPLLQGTLKIGVAAEGEVHRCLQHGAVDFLLHDGFHDGADRTVLAVQEGNTGIVFVELH